VIGVLAVLAVAAFLAIALVAMGAKPAVPSKVLLEIDFQKGVEEMPPDDPFSDLIGDKVTTVRDVVEGLEKAASDPRVVGLVARVGEGGPMGLGRVQEVRDAVLAFRKKGKPAVAFSETFGEFAAGNRSYYLATAFEPVYLQPSGDIGFTGLMSQSMFFKGTFDKLGLVPRMDHRYEYKNAMNVYTEKKYTEPHREATKKVVDSIWSQIVRGIAEARKLPEADVRALADRGPYLGQEASPTATRCCPGWRRSTARACGGSPSPTTWSGPDGRTRAGPRSRSSTAWARSCAGRAARARSPSRPWGRTPWPARCGPPSTTPR
jgi:protease-4